MVTSFAADLRAFADETVETLQAIVRQSVELSAESIVHGSSNTGSPGQPADLRDGDWVTKWEGEWVASITTDEPSARSVEDGVSYEHGGKPLRKLKSPIGGFHSVKLTVMGFPTIVDVAALRVRGVDSTNG